MGSHCARMRVPTGRLRIVSTQASEVAELQDGPPSPGRYIRDQRQRRGMSIEQLAIDTKIPRASIEALEEDRFSVLPGPVFVRGFFRCCARSLGLDPEAVMAILSEHLRAQQPGAKSSRRPAVHAVREAPATRTARSPAGPPAPAAATAGAAAPAAVAAPALDLRAWFEGAVLGLSRALAQVPHTRALMWIAVCVVVAAIAATAFALAMQHMSLPSS